MTLALEALNRMSPADFAAAIGDTFELAPWVADSAAGRRPFSTVTTLHEALMAVVRSAPHEQQLAFLRGLAGEIGMAAQEGQLLLALGRTHHPHHRLVQGGYR